MLDTRVAMAIQQQPHTQGHGRSGDSAGQRLADPVERARVAEILRGVAQPLQMPIEQDVALDRCPTQRLEQVEGRDRLTLFRASLSESSIDLVDCFLDRSAATLVRRHRQLLLELGAGQAQRFEHPHPLGIADRAAARLGAFELQLVHALLNARFRVDQSLACVSHSSLSPACAEA